MPRIRTQDDFLRRALTVHAEAHYDYSGVVYQRSNQKIDILCPLHGTFTQTPASHLRGRGCPACKGMRISARLRRTPEEFLQQARDIHGSKYDYSRTEYVGNHRKVMIVCPEHGEFQQTPANHLSGQGCPRERGARISATKRSTASEFIRKAREVHGDRYDYSAVQYVRSAEQVGILCREHGLFLQIPNDHLFGYQCPQCGRKEAGDALRLSGEEFLERARAVHGEAYDYSDTVYDSAHSKVSIRCPEHGLFEQSPANHIRQGNGCPLCTDHYSSGHREVDDFLRTLGVEVVTNTRSVIPPKELDTYLPVHKLAIEFNGGYWHSLGEGQSHAIRSRHKDKYLLCAAQGIHLLQIDQHEWEDPITREIWKSILQSKIGRHTRKVHARHTMFHTVTPMEANQFLALHHLQGATSAVRWCYGLYFEAELLAVMTFSGHEKTSLNLTRMAFARNTTVVGGARKLFQNALRLLPDRPIVTFANQRYSRGDVYRTMGFSLDADLPPSYQWLYQGNVLDKRMCRHKHLPKLIGDLYNPSLTEHQNMFRAGARCLYDAGYQRWMYHQ